MEPVIVQARSLSSGTIATLIDSNEYEVIDKTRYWFIRFVETAVRDCDLPPVTTWQIAWRMFVGGVKLTYGTS